MLEPCSINHLPNETLVHIMSFLEAKDLVLTERVSKIWQEVSNCDFLWRRHYEAKYGESGLVSLAYPHPKAAFLLPIYIKSFHYVLKPLPVQLSKRSLKLELHGQYLIQRNEITLNEPCSKITECPFIYDLIRQEQIPRPQFFDGASFIKWIVCNKEYGVIVQDRNGRLIYSEPPFARQITYDNFNGLVLDVAGSSLFYTSKDKMQLSMFDLNESKTSFTMSLDTPIQYFFASEHCHAAFLQNNIIIFNDPSDLSKSINVSFAHKKADSVLSNPNWLIITGEEFCKSFFLACNLATGKLHTDLILPIGYEKFDNLRVPLTCRGLELCNNYLFVSDTERTSVLNLEGLNSENAFISEKKNIEFGEYSRPLLSFRDRILFFLSGLKDKIYFIDVSTDLKNQMDLDIYLDGKMITEVVANNRFIVVSYGFDKIVKFCDLLAPERSSSKHFISLNDNRAHKKTKSQSFHF